MGYYNTISINIDPDDVLCQMTTEEILDTLEMDDIIDYIKDHDKYSEVHNVVSCLNILARYIKSNSNYSNLVTKENMIEYVTELINDNFYLISR